MRASTSIADHFSATLQAFDALSLPSPLMAAPAPNSVTLAAPLANHSSNFLQNVNRFCIPTAPSDSLRPLQVSVCQQDTYLIFSPQPSPVDASVSVPAPTALLSISTTATFDVLPSTNPGALPALSQAMPSSFNFPSGGSPPLLTTPVLHSLPTSYPQQPSDLNQVPGAAHPPLHLSSTTAPVQVGAASGEGNGDHTADSRIQIARKQLRALMRARRRGNPLHRPESPAESCGSISSSESSCASSSSPRHQQQQQRRRRSSRSNSNNNNNHQMSRSSSRANVSVKSEPMASDSDADDSLPQVQVKLEVQQEEEEDKTMSVKLEPMSSDSASSSSSPPQSVTSAPNSPPSVADVYRQLSHNPNLFVCPRQDCLQLFAQFPDFIAHSNAHPRP